MDASTEPHQPAEPSAFTEPSVGSSAVFAGDWSFYGNNGGNLRVPVGFSGTLVDWWNGHAVFSCDRTVAADIVAEQNRMRDVERERLVTDGTDSKDLDEYVDQAYPPMFFDGDDIVTDESAISGEPAINRSSPDANGRYIVNGWHWTWQVVEPTDCDRISGHLPDNHDVH